MGLTIETKPTPEIFVSARLETENSAIMHFKKSGKGVKINQNGYHFDQSFRWDVVDLRSLADACNEIADMLDGAG